MEATCSFCQHCIILGFTCLSILDKKNKLPLFYNLYLHVKVNYIYRQLVGIYAISVATIIVYIHVGSVLTHSFVWLLIFNSPGLLSKLVFAGQVVSRSQDPLLWCGTFPVLCYDNCRLNWLSHDRLFFKGTFNTPRHAHISSFYDNTGVDLDAFGM